MRSQKTIYGLAQIIVDSGLISKEQMLAYQCQADAAQLPLAYFLFDHSILSAQDIALLFAKHLSLPYLDLDTLDADTHPIAMVNVQLLRQHRVLPTEFKEQVLFIAIDEPTKLICLKELHFHTGMEIKPVIVEIDKLAQRFQQLIEQNSLITEDQSLSQLLEHIIIDAVQKGASDIHFEPYDLEYRIRYRIDGLLTKIHSPTEILPTRLSVRIKIMANLDIGEKRLPQDGSFKLKISPTQTVDCRISTCPVTHGEKIVLRFLNNHLRTLSIQTLALNPQQELLLSTASQSPQGLILVTGPTGSGKTTTLYSVLNTMNSVEKNIVSVEDPVEIGLQGINQVNIHAKSGLTFNNVLRAFLRQDPDIIMVGEIRDLETAELAIQAAQTGHLVLSTLHTNNAAESLTRLMSMGIPRFNLAYSLHLLVAQRLVRKLCEACKQLNSNAAQEIRDWGLNPDLMSLDNIYQAQGCSLCHQGYHGRMGLFEMMPFTPAINDAIARGASIADILSLANKNGMISLQESALEKIQQGITSIEEIKRVLRL